MSKVSDKLTFLTPWYAHVPVGISGGEKLVFSENFAYVLNEWSLMGRCYFLRREKPYYTLWKLVERVAKGQKFSQTHWLRKFLEIWENRLLWERSSGNNRKIVFITVRAENKQRFCPELSMEDVKSFVLSRVSFFLLLFVGKHLKVRNLSIKVVSKVSLNN